MKNTILITLALVPITLAHRSLAASASASSAHSISSQSQLQFSCPQICASLEESHADLLEGIEHLVRPKILSTQLFPSFKGQTSAVAEYIQKHPSLTLFPAPKPIGSDHEYFYVFPSRAIVKGWKSGNNSATIAALLNKPNPFVNTPQEIKHAVYAQLSKYNSDIRSHYLHGCSLLKRSIELGNLLRPEFNALVAAAGIQNQMHTDHDILKECIPSGSTTATLHAFKKYKIDQMRLAQKHGGDYYALRRGGIKPLTDPKTFSLYCLADEKPCEAYSSEQEEQAALDQVNAAILSAQDELLTRLQTHCPNEMNAIIAVLKKTLVVETNADAAIVKTNADTVASASTPNISTCTLL